MALTSNVTPEKSNEVSNSNDEVSSQGLDAKGFVDGGTKDFSSLPHSELQELVKSKVLLFVRELDGFNEWYCLHILECVKEELTAKNPLFNQVVFP